MFFDGFSQIDCIYQCWEIFQFVLVSIFYLLNKFFVFSFFFRVKFGWFQCFAYLLSLESAFLGFARISVVILWYFLINLVLSDFFKFFKFLMDFKSSEGLLRFFFVESQRILLEIEVDLMEQEMEAILIVEFFSAINLQNYQFEGRKYEEQINQGELKRGISRIRRVLLKRIQFSWEVNDLIILDDNRILIYTYVPTGDLKEEINQTKKVLIFKDRRQVSRRRWIHLKSKVVGQRDEFELKYKESSLILKIKAIENDFSESRRT